jgi:hypothetical protein
MADMTPGLLRAIEGFSGANAGKKEHETNIALLQRVKADIERGKASPSSTPGQREAIQAAQKNMPAESGHSGGDGQKTSNEPGSAHHGDPAVDMHEDSSEERKISGAGPVPSRGQLLSVHSAPAAASGIADIRRMAAEKELSRPDTKFTPIKRSGDGNKESNLPGKAAPNTKRIGDVRSAAKAPGDKNTEGDGFEGVPPFAKESLAKDGWGGAAKKAREMYATKK